MKKTALFFLAAILVIGIQSCTTDEREEITPQDFSIDKESPSEKNNSTCFKSIYMNYGNMGDDDRRLFINLAKSYWFDNDVIILNTSCRSIDIWKTPCDSLYTSKNDEEEDIIIDAEASLTLGEGGAPRPPSVTEVPTYLEADTFNYNICVTGIGNPTIDNGEDENGNQY